MKQRVIDVRATQPTPRLILNTVLLWAMTRVIATTTDYQRAASSRFVWGVESPGIYQLRVLGVVHALTGITLEVEK